MTKKNVSNKDERVAMLIRTLTAAETNLALAKKILSDIYGSKVALVNTVSSVRDMTVSPRDVPGVEGTFDGQNMLGMDGKKYPVPENYASKSELVYGDKLKVIRREDGNWFKQISKVERVPVQGILAKDGDNQWRLVTDSASYKIISAAVAYHKGEEGKDAVGLVPKGKSDVPFAALRSVEGKEGENKEGGDGKGKGKDTKDKDTKEPEVTVAAVEEKKDSKSKKEPENKEGKGKKTPEKKTVVKSKKKEVKKSPRKKAAEKPASVDVDIPGDDELR